MTGYNFYLDHITFTRVSLPEFLRYFGDVVKAICLRNADESYLQYNKAFDYGARFNDGHSFDEIWYNQDFLRTYPQIANRISSISAIPESPEKLNDTYPDGHNAFWGTGYEEKTDHHVTCYDEYADFKHKFKTSVALPADFWSQKDILYPHLAFCPDLKEQINKFYGYIGLLKKTFAALNRFVEESWAEGENIRISDFQSKASIKVKDESDTVKTNAKLSSLRNWKLPDGTYVVSYYHISIAAGFRLYIWPDLATHKIAITGFVHHLPTANF